MLTARATGAVLVRARNMEKGAVLGTWGQSVIHRDRLCVGVVCVCILYGEKLGHVRLARGAEPHCPTTRAHLRHDRAGAHLCRPSVSLHCGFGGDPARLCLWSVGRDSFDFYSTS